MFWALLLLARTLFVIFEFAKIHKFLCVCLLQFLLFYTFKNPIFSNFPISPLQDVIKIDQKHETNTKYFVQTQDLPLTTATVLPKLCTVSTVTIPLARHFRHLPWTKTHSKRVGFGQN